MIDPKTFLIKLNKNLNILQERAAKYAGDAPLGLLNQIDDHKEAIALVRQALTGELTQAGLGEALKPLNLAEPGMTLGQRINNFFFGSDYPRQQRNRQAMLKLVDNF